MSRAARAASRKAALRICVYGSSSRLTPDSFIRGTYVQYHIRTARHDYLALTNGVIFLQLQKTSDALSAKDHTFVLTELESLV